MHTWSLCWYARMCAHKHVYMGACVCTVSVCVCVCACEHVSVSPGAQAPDSSGPSGKGPGGEGTGCGMPVLPLLPGNRALHIVHLRPDFSMIDGLGTNSLFLLKKIQCL